MDSTFHEAYFYNPAFGHTHFAKFNRKMRYAISEIKRIIAMVSLRPSILDPPDDDQSRNIHYKYQDNCDQSPVIDIY
jgi:hypothetical protein